MIDKFVMFRSLLDFFTNGVGDVIDADLNYYDGAFRIAADDGENDVEMTVVIKKKVSE